MAESCRLELRMSNPGAFLEEFGFCDGDFNAFDSRQVKLEDQISTRFLEIQVSVLSELPTSPYLM